VEIFRIAKVDMNLEIRPLTPDLWPALEDLFGANGACNGCWCMYWRIGRAYQKRPRERNKAALREIVMKGPPPGLLAFDGDMAVGWCQLTPRDALPQLDRAWRLRRVDDTPVWAISCFYIRKGYRRRGVTSALIAAALETAKNAGAPALEAYPLDAGSTPSSSWTGYASTFARAGFRIVARRTPPRPIMRRDLTASLNQPPARTPATNKPQLK
jgi:GNAT superfamily N-acetyltransferase